MKYNIKIEYEQEDFCELFEKILEHRAREVIEELYDENFLERGCREDE